MPAGAFTLSSVIVVCHCDHATRAGGNCPTGHSTASMSIRLASDATDRSRDPAVVVNVLFCSSGAAMLYSFTARPV